MPARIFADVEGPYPLASGRYVLRIIEIDGDGREVRYGVEGDTPDECRELVALIRLDVAAEAAAVRA